jgi:hypothetical protein
MALVSGTTTKYDGVGIREDLGDDIFNISPTETPFTSSLKRGGKASNTLTEWQTDSLAAVDGTNAHLEGDEASYTTVSPTVRVGNYCQISRKTLNISGTYEAVDKAGRDSEIAYQKAKKAKEFKRDMETIFLRAQAGNAGGVGTARTLAAMNAWVKTNVSTGSGGGNPTYTSGVPSAVRTDGTQRAFTETIHKAVLQSIWTSGGEPKVLMVGPFNKTVVSGFSGVVTRNFDMSNVSAKPTAVIASADVYVSDFGTVRVIPNRFQRERDGWYPDFDLLKLRWLRPVFTEQMAKTGDADKFLMVGEYTLEVSQEAGMGLAADLNAS